jgi:hypothetical protein
MNSGILFGFKDLINSTPPSKKSIFDLSSLIFKDSYLKTINPKRYNFYMKFVNGLANPENLEKFFYTTKESKIYKQELNEKIANLMNVVKQLDINSGTTESNKVKDDIIDAIKERYNFSDDVISKLKTLVKGGADVRLNKGDEPMQNFINVVKKKLPIIQPTGLKTVDDLFEDTKPNAQSTGMNKSEINNMATQIYNTYKDDVNPEIMEIKMMDRIVFIITTFLIRYISLIIVKWGLDTSLINSFHSAFYYYAIIYLILFTFITMFVNVVIAYPIMQLFSNKSIVNIPNLFYYFYIYANGSLRLLLHISFIIVLLFVPYIINIDKINLKRNDKKQENISTDNQRKEKIYNSIIIFSTIIWVLTSIVSLKF